MRRRCSRHHYSTLLSSSSSSNLIPISCCPIIMSDPSSHSSSSPPLPAPPEPSSSPPLPPRLPPPHPFANRRSPSTFSFFSKKFKFPSVSSLFLSSDFPSSSSSALSSPSSPSPSPSLSFYRSILSFAQRSPLIAFGIPLFSVMCIGGLTLSSSLNYQLESLSKTQHDLLQHDDHSLDFRYKTIVVPEVQKSKGTYEIVRVPRPPGEFDQ